MELKSTRRLNNKYSEKTPLHFLCRYYKNANLIDLVKLLVKNGADVNVKGWCDRTPLHLLCLNYENNDLIDLVKFFIQNGADINAKLTWSGEYGWTPLHDLCLFYENDELIVDIVKIMIENGVNINSVAMMYRGEEKTPLEMSRDRGISL